MRGKQNLSMEIKGLAETGSFEGVLATYGNLDLGNDVIEVGAFSKTLAEHGTECKLLWQHDPASVIGTLQLIDGPDALRVKGQIELDDDIPFSRTAYKLLKKRLLSGLSIGYDVVKDQINGGVRHLKELRLWEGSLVTFPMNEKAGVTAIKRRTPAESKDDFTEEYNEGIILAAPWQMLDAITEALLDLLSSDLSTEEVVAGAQLALGQFTDAWLAWLPQYLELIATDPEDDAGGMETMKRGPLELKAKLIRAGRKEGRRFSGATRSALKDCSGHVKSADTILSALTADEAGGEEDSAATSEAKAALEKPEPVSDHSAAQLQITSILALIPAANGRGK